MTSNQRRRALVLAHESEGGGAQLGRRLAERGFEIDTHVVTPDADAANQAAPFPDLDGYDLLVPMGSVRSLTRTDEIDSWVHLELDLIADAHRRGMPILGVCFGGQLIAMALGGSVEPSPAFENGWYTLADGPDGPNPVGPGPWFEWHHDRFTPPPEAEVLAVTAEAVQLIRIGTTVGTQFHPEIDAATIATWLSMAPDSYLAEHGVDADRLLAETIEQEAHNIEQCHALVDWFLDTVAFTSGEAASAAAVGST